ncbi:retrovirus-related pol polyprotein from transposon TNT 1-94 [Tanacetum coccineum]
MARGLALAWLRLCTLLILHNNILIPWFSKQGGAYTEGEHLKLKGKNVVDTAVSKPSATIATGMFNLDIEPISHRLKNNRDAYEVYLEKTIENTDTLHGLVECARKQNPRVKPTTSARGLKPLGNTNNNRITRPPSSNQKNKVEEHPRKLKYRLNKMNFVSEPISNALVKHSVRNAKFKSICAICNKCLFDANHDMCVIDYVNDVNVRRTFTIVRNMCPLTRITSTKVVPTKETNNKSVLTPTQRIIVYSRRPKASRSVVQIVLWYLDSGCSKHMIGNRSQLINFVSKFLGTIRFGNDHIAKIMGYGDNQMGNVTISWVYYIEGLRYNLFSVGQFCDFDLEVAFRKHSCFICDLEGVDLLKGSRGSNLYTLSMDNLMLSSPICLLSKASKTKSWLWHRRLSHLNFEYITSLAKQGKGKKHSHKPKAVDSIQEKLYLLHMDLYRLMRIQSINGRKYILVIVDDYSRFTWVKFLQSKDEVP